LTALMLIGLFPTSVLAADSDVASLNGTEYATIQAAVEAAEDGDEITLISDIALTTESYVTNSDGYAVFVNVANKAVTIDLNGKSVTVDASAADLTGAKSTMLLGVFSADDNSVLTLKDSNLSISVTSGKSASREGNVVTIPYAISGTSVTTGTKAYVMVTDKGYTESGASVLQYTALTAGSESGFWGNRHFPVFR